MATCTPTVDGDTFKAQCWRSFCTTAVDPCSYCKCAACSQCSVPRPPRPLPPPPPPAPRAPPPPRGPGDCPIGTTDLTRDAHAVASSSESARRGADAAVDNNDRTRWASLFEDGQWLAIEIRRPASLRSVSVLWEAGLPTAYELQLMGDDLPLAEARGWHSVARQEAPRAGWVITPLPEGTVSRSLRLYAEHRATRYGISLFTLRLCGSGVPPPPPPAPPRSPPPPASPPSTPSPLPPASPPPPWWKPLPKPPPAPRPPSAPPPPLPRDCAAGHVLCDDRAASHLTSHEVKARDKPDPPPPPAPSIPPPGRPPPPPRPSPPIDYSLYFPPPRPSLPPPPPDLPPALIVSLASSVADLADRVGALNAGVVLAILAATAALAFLCRSRRSHRSRGAFQAVSADDEEAAAQPASRDKGAGKRPRRKRQGGRSAAAAAAEEEVEEEGKLLTNGSGGGGTSARDEGALARDADGSADERPAAAPAPQPTALACAPTESAEERGLSVKFVWRSRQREAHVPLTSLRSFDVLCIDLAERGSRLLGMALRPSQLQLHYKVQRQGVMRRVQLTRSTKWSELKRCDGLLVTEADVERADAPPEPAPTRHSRRPPPKHSALAFDVE